MAWLQVYPSSGLYHVSFRFGGNKYKRSLKTTDHEEAGARLVRLEENIRLVESGRLEIPDGADVPTFLMSDGKVARKQTVLKTPSLGLLFDDYFDNLPDGGLEDTTLQCMKIHRRHLENKLGTRFNLQSLTTDGADDLQKYINRRAKEKGIRGRTLSATTIRKEITTLRAIWNQASAKGMLKGAFPNQHLRYPKDREKPPFQTWDEIERQIAIAELTEAETAELWDCLFLTCPQIEELLDDVQKNGRHEFLYPMFVMAAHTGMRRSEILRSEWTDISDDFITIREKKRIKRKTSTRRVPLSRRLKEALAVWKEQHPGGKMTFCLGDIKHSRIRRDQPRPLSRDEANDHFKRALSDSKWKVVRGWHCFRHSFCSNSAMQGIDQRLIDSWVGHTTEAMRRRYRHLIPSKETEALQAMFG